jgi:hypothetical protein
MTFQTAFALFALAVSIASLIYSMHVAAIIAAH